MSDQHKTRQELIDELAALRRELASSRATEGERTRRVLEHLRAVIVEIDGEGRIVYVSDTLTDLLGYHPTEVMQGRGVDWIHEEDRNEIRAHTRRLLDAGSSKAVYRALHKSGHWLWLETTSSTYQLPNGSTRTVSFTWDITEGKHTGDALRDSEDRFRAITENASDIITEVDENGRILYLSPNARGFSNVPFESFVGRTLKEVADPEVVHPKQREALMAGLSQPIVFGEGTHLGLSLRHNDGTWHWFDSSAKSYESSDGSVHTVFISRDVTERVRAQRELRHSEERYRVLAESTWDMISETDAEGRLVYVSPSITEVLGYRPEEVVGTTPFSLVHPDDIERSVDGFLENTEARVPTRLHRLRVRHRNGSWRWIEGRGIRFTGARGEIRLLTACRDVTERLEFEERMQQTQKLEGLGVLAGGIAHDFNNLLTPILGDASLAQRELPADSPVRARLRKIERTAQKAAALTHQMLAYAGKGPRHEEPVDLSRLVEEMGQLLESGVSSRAALVSELARGLPAVEADAAQLSQVLLNLITNASEAVGKAGGRIELRTGSVDLDREQLARMILGADLPSGLYVYFEVSDSGCGMDARTRSRIFDPFFTTKFTGRGIGLAATLGIVRGHQGAIDVESERGHGTRFRVVLPASAIAAPTAHEPACDSGWRGRGTVLVVDDDDGVRDLVADTLTRAGLRVLCAGGGLEGIEIFRSHAAQIDAVLLDHTMPGTSGEETFDAMREIDPAAAIVLVSGYPEERAAAGFRDRGLNGFLQKPFLPETLVERVRTILETI